MANIIVPASGSNPIATVLVTRDSTQEHIQLMNITDQLANDAVGNGATGITMPAGGVGMLGWQSGIYSKLANQLTVSGPGINSSGSGQFVPQADSSIAINNVTASSTLIAGVTGKSIYVTHIDWLANWTGTLAFGYGTAPTLLTGPYAVQPQVGFGNTANPLFIVPAGQDFKIILTGTNPSVSGLISYYQG